MSFIVTMVMATRVGAWNYDNGDGDGVGVGVGVGDDDRQAGRSDNQHHHREHPIIILHARPSEPYNGSLTLDSGVGFEPTTFGL